MGSGSRRGLRLRPRHNTRSRPSAQPRSAGPRAGPGVDTRLLGYAHPMRDRSVRRGPRSFGQLRPGAAGTVAARLGGFLATDRARPRAEALTAFPTEVDAWPT